jgi:hypothetical protein
VGGAAKQIAAGAGLVGIGILTGQPWIVAAGIGIGLGGVSQAMMPGVKTPKTGPVNRTVRSSTAFDFVPYGTVRTGGTMVAMDRHQFVREGNDPDYLDLVIVVSPRRIQYYYPGIFIGDEWVPLVINAKNGFDNLIDRLVPADSHVPDTDSRFHRHLSVRFRVGTHVSADTYMINRQRATENYWTADHKLLNNAYVIVSLRWNQDIWAQGVPVVSFKIQGVQVYDPRDGATRWTDNPALCLADYLAGPYGPAGVGYEEIDIDALIAAANICAEQVLLPKPEKRYRLSTIVSAEEDWRSVAPSISQAMAGGFFRVGASWVIIAGAPTAPTMTLGPDDTMGELDVTPRRSRRDLFNAATVICRDEDDRYQPAEPVSIAPIRFLAEDNHILLPREIDLQKTVASTGQAERIASIELHQNRQQISVTGTFGWRAMPVKVGDVVLLSSDRMGWDGKPFRCVQWELDFAEGIKLSLAEYCDAIYAYPAAAALFDCYPSTLLPVPGGINQVPFLTVQREPSGNSLITWGQPAAFNLVGFDLQWREVGEVTSDGYGFTDDSWIELERSVTTSSGFIEAGTLQYSAPIGWPGVYRVRIRALLSGGIFGEWVAVISYPTKQLAQVGSALGSADAPDDDDYFSGPPGATGGTGSPRYDSGGP